MPAPPTYMMSHQWGHPILIVLQLGLNKKVFIFTLNEKIKLYGPIWPYVPVTLYSPTSEEFMQPISFVWHIN